MKIGLNCEICGHTEKLNLQYHLKDVHSLTTKEYKLAYKGSRTMTGHSKRTVEYWYYKGHSYEDSLRLVKESQKEPKVVYIDKLEKSGLTSEQAIGIWNNKQAINSIRSVEYYLSRGFSKEESIDKVSKVQSKYSAKSSKFLGHNHTEESKLRISENLIEQIKVEGAGVRVSRFTSGREGVRSKGEIECYTYLKNIYPTLECNVSIEGKVVDMVIDSTIIEFNGDFWHRNPRLYSEDFIKYGKTSKEVWEREERRLSYLKSIGYAVYIIWELDWNNNREQVLVKFKKQLYENRSKESTKKS